MYKDLMNNENKLGVYIHAISLKEFMEQDPPCKNCLIQGMCIKESVKTNDLNQKYSSIKVSICEEFNEYLKRMSKKHYETN